MKKLNVAKGMWFINKSYSIYLDNLNKEHLSSEIIAKRKAKGSAIRTNLLNKIGSAVKTLNNKAFNENIDEDALKKEAIKAIKIVIASAEIAGKPVNLKEKDFNKYVEMMVEHMLGDVDPLEEVTEIVIRNTVSFFEDGSKIRGFNKDLLIGNGTVVKEALKKLGVSEEIAREVYLAYAHKPEGPLNNHLLQKAFNKAMYRVAHIATRVSPVVEGSPVVDYVELPNSSLVRTLAKENGFDKKVRSGKLGGKVTIYYDGSCQVTDGRVAMFGGTSRNTCPINNVLYMDLEAMANFDEESDTFEEMWTEYFTNGILFDSKNTFLYSPENAKIKGAKLYIVVSLYPSGAKRGKFIMAHFGTNDLDKAYEIYAQKLNNLDNGALGFIEEGGKKSKCKKYTKRIFSMSCANAVKLGELDLEKYCILVKEDKWTDDSEMHAHKEEYESSPIDGQSLIKLSFWRYVLQQYFGKLYGKIQVLTSNPQLRVGGLAIKTFGKVKTDEMFEAIENEVRKDPTYHVIGNPDGECVFIGDANAVKLIEEFLASSTEAQSKLKGLGLFLMNFAHKSKSSVHLGTQISNKFTGQFRPEYERNVALQHKRNLTDEFMKVKKGQKGEPMDFFDPIDVLLSKVMGERAIYTTAVQKSLIKRIADSLSPVAKKGAVEVPGCTLAASMEMAPVIAPNKFFKILTSYEGVYEMYSSDMIKDREALFRDYLDENGNMVNCDYKFTSFKMPSQTMYEHICCQMMTLEELVLRVALGYQKMVDSKKISKSEAAALAGEVVMNLRFDGAGTVMMANVNPVANQLAGFDKDFDHLFIVTSKWLNEMLRRKEQIEIHRKAVNAEGKEVTVHAIGTLISKEDPRMAEIEKYSLL